MGKSKNIRDLEKEDTEFRAYINGVSSELKSDSNSAREEMSSAIRDFYVSYHGDHQLVLEGENADFYQESEFSLEKIVGIVNAIAKAVLGTVETVDGVSFDSKGVEEAKKTVGQAVGTAGALELYVASKALEVISAALVSLGSNASAGYRSAYKSIPLGYGMQLFTITAAKSFKQQKFLGGSTIVENLYVYKMFFSLEQAKKEGQRTLVTMYSDQLAALASRAKDLYRQLGAGTIALEQYAKMSEVIDGLIDKVTEKLDRLKREDEKTLLAARRDVLSSVKATTEAQRKIVAAELSRVQARIALQVD